MKHIRSYWSKLSLANKFTFVLISMITFLLLILGVVVIESREANQIRLTNDRMQSQAEDLHTMLEIKYTVESQQENQLIPKAEQILRATGMEGIDSILATLNLNQFSQPLSNSLSEEDISFMEEIFTDTSYYLSGYPVLIDDKGNFLIHPLHKGKHISDTKLFTGISRIKNGYISYQWPEEGNNQENLIIYFRHFTPLNVYVGTIIDADEVLMKPLVAIRYLVFMSILVGIILMYFSIRYLMRLITRPIDETAGILEKLSLGINQNEHDTNRKDEIGKMYGLINSLITGLRKTAEFAIEIGKKNFDHPFTPRSKEDALGNALIDMRESLKKAEDDENLRKIEDEKRRWTNEGLAKFGEILRLNNDNMEVLSNHIIKNLVKYLKINQGGLFIVNNRVNGEDFLEMTACYAFDRQKFLKKSFEFGEGITGTCVLEKQTIYIKKIPDNYISITSGLGDAAPEYLLVVPLKLNEEVHGVVELASFSEFQPHEIEFVEKIGQSIASTISGVKINVQTTELLEQSQQQSEEMRAQEEEMRQNMEEMQSTQEELQRRNEEMRTIQQNLNKESVLLTALLSSSEDYIYFKDKDSKFIRVSDSMLKMLELNNQKEIEGLSDFDFAPREVAQPKYEAEQEIIRTGEILKLEEKDIGKDGTERWVSTVKIPLKDDKGNNVGTFGVSRDITHFKEAIAMARSNENELAEKVQQIQNLQNEMELQQKTIIKILNEIPQKVYLKDKDLKFVFVNQAVANVYENKTIEDLIGTDDFDHYNKELAATYSNSDYEVLEKGEQTFEQEDIVKGLKKIVRSNKKPFYIDYLNQTGLLGIQTDITDIENYRELEKENQWLREELEKMDAEKKTSKGSG